MFFDAFEFVDVALAVTSKTLDSRVRVKSLVVSDRDAVDSCLQFADQHRFLVEPACGAALSAFYVTKYYEDVIRKYKNVVVVVCGGSVINFDLLSSMKKDYM